MKSSRTIKCSRVSLLNTIHAEEKQCVWRHSGTLWNASNNLKSGKIHVLADTLSGVPNESMNVLEVLNIELEDASSGSEEDTFYESV